MSQESDSDNTTDSRIELSRRNFIVGGGSLNAAAALGDSDILSIKRGFGQTSSQSTQGFSDDFDYPTEELEDNGWNIVDEGAFRTSSSNLIADQVSERANIYRTQENATGTFEILGARHDADFYGLAIDFISNGTIKQENTAGYRIGFTNDVGDDAGNVIFTRIDENGGEELAILDEDHFGSTHDVRIERDPETFEFTIFYDGEEIEESPIDDDTYTESKYWTMAYRGRAGEQQIDAVQFSADQSSKEIGLTSVRPVQVVENSRIIDPGNNSLTGQGLIEAKNPEMVANKSTTVLFGIDDSDFDIDQINRSTGITAEINVEDEDKETVLSDSIQLDKRDIEELASDSFAEIPITFDNRNLSPPVFEMPSSKPQINISLTVDQEDFSGDEKTLAANQDFGLENNRFNLAIGWIKDPEFGENYGDDTGRIERPAGNDIEDQFELHVQKIREYLIDEFPISSESLNLYTFDFPVLGNTNATSGPVRLLADLKSARLTIGPENVNLDAVLAIVPNGYLEYNGLSATGVEVDFPEEGVNDVQPRTAAAAQANLGVNGRNLTNPRRTAEVAAQELGHHFFPLNSPYPDAAALRNYTELTSRPAGKEGVFLDGAHARSRNQKVDIDNDGNNEINDPLGLVSTAYDLSNNIYDIDKKSDSFMSYAFGQQKASDTIAYQDLIDSGFDPQPPVNDQREDKLKTGVGFVISWAKNQLEDQTGFILSPTISPTAPTGTVNEGPVEVTVESPDGSAINQRCVLDSVLIRDGPPVDGSDGREIDDISVCNVLFPEEATKIEIENTVIEEKVEFNPITETLRTLFNRIPDTAFKSDPDGLRQALFNRLDTAERHIKNSRFRAARNVMESIYQTIERQLEDDYETDSAGAPNKQDVLSAIEDRIDRLTGLVDGDNN